MSQTQQLETWSGEFGTAYTDRNIADLAKRTQAFREIIQDLPITRVLEVGCNRGHNLVAFSEIIGESAEVCGIEPNPYALRTARASSDRISALKGTAFELPFRDGYFDLVFTAGVLIHISLADLPRAISEIVRTSRRYVLALEYFAEEETTIPYRGSNDLLWKRNFLAHYQTQFPELKLVRSGYYDQEQGFDRTHWWLLEKPQP